MIKILVLILGIVLILFGLVYIIRLLFNIQKGTVNSQSINKKGVFTAIGAIILGAFLVYKNTKKSN
jgi:hypothetical protein